jgi:hypothetical protein
MINASIAHRRLRAQRLIGPAHASPADAVRSMGALQAQDYAQALWAIGARSASGSINDVERAIRDREIVRTWPMRGTIHFVPARDAAWITALCTPRSIAAAALRQTHLDLDDATLARCGDILRNVLTGAVPVSRPDLLRRIDEHGVSTAAQRGYHILVHHAQRGLVCQGPFDGTQPTFVLLDEWVTDPVRYSRDDALAELARRYFTSHGPATIHDFANWCNLPMADARAALGSVQGALVREVIDGDTYWMDQAHATIDESHAEPLQLLPGFDEYLLGYRERGAVVTPDDAQRIVPGSNGVFRPMLVEHGQVTGTWARTVTSRGVALELTFFAAKRRRTKRVIDEACARYARFLNQTILSITLV